MLKPIPRPYSPIWAWLGIERKLRTWAHNTSDPDMTVDNEAYRCLNEMDMLTKSRQQQTINCTTFILNNITQLTQIAEIITVTKKNK